MADYLRPVRLEDALSAAAAGARIAAGCTDLFPGTSRQRLSGPIVDITRVGGLRGISRAVDGWRIGAATTWSDVVAADLPPCFDGLKAAAREVGSLQIQNAGTIGGNLCNASPAADGVPPLLTLDAAVELASGAGTRRLPLPEFLRGVRKTALRPGEILTAIHVPDLPGKAGFLKLGARRYLVISIAMVATRLHVADGRIRAAALAVGACGPVAVRLPVAEAALTGVAVDNAAEVLTDELTGSALSPISDIRADDDYRRAAAGELLRRAVYDLLTVGGGASE